MLNAGLLVGLLANLVAILRDIVGRSIIGNVDVVSVVCISEVRAVAAIGDAARFLYVGIMALNELV